MNTAVFVLLLVLLLAVATYLLIGNVLLFVSLCCTDNSPRTHERFRTHCPTLLFIYCNLCGLGGPAPASRLPRLPGPAHPAHPKTYVDVRGTSNSAAVPVVRVTAAEAAEAAQAVPADVSTAHESLDKSSDENSFSVV